MKTFWLSGSDKGVFLGACIVDAEDFVSAILKANLAECNPHGELFGVEILPGSMVIPSEAKHVLLTQADCEKFFGPMINTKEAEQIQKMQGGKSN